MEKKKIISHNSAVCILGMHRSGTSCLAGCLQERGLYLGAVANASPYNRKGNKENSQLQAINDDVLTASGGSWDRPPKYLSWNDVLRQRRDQHIEGFGSREVWGFKDPRTVLTLPFWIEALPNLRFVGTFRHPSAVIMSLLQRPGLAPATPSLVLWSHYNRLLLNFVDQYELPLVCFDWPAHTYVQAVEKIVCYLNLQQDANATFYFFEESIRTQNLNTKSSPTIGSEELSIYEDLMTRSTHS